MLTDNGVIVSVHIYQSVTRNLAKYATKYHTYFAKIYRVLMRELRNYQGLGIYTILSNTNYYTLCVIT